jgi:hypothetical protein
MPAPRSKNVELLSRPTGSTQTQQEQLAHRQVLRGGTSPFVDQPEAQPLDTSVTVSCTCCSPPRRFVGTAGKTAEEWLARHAEGLTVGRAAREAVNAERRRKSYAKQADLTTRPSARGAFAGPDTERAGV